MRLLRPAALGLTLAVALVLPAAAHPGHGTDSFTSGLLHPFGGLDHLLAMVAVGLIAARIGLATAWRMPAAFMTAMALGALAGFEGTTLPGIEYGIALSVAAAGLALALAMPIPTLAAIGATAAFGFCHGMAHGLELPDAASPISFSLGMLLGTALLHGAGFVVGLAMRNGTGLTLCRAGGAVAAAVGVVMLVG
ncbi:HupE/UreJ family protein [Plastoroseomonas hellenica]|uniref:HupE/UreJ family protein n=1 Tax=Plastoroseomonas hellenica TaxID=2687306 RepID=UPI001BAA7037|nr:HupE/UreJ family protein [Plastoroseomonas hellenica]MBR0644286.1 HupE/UreJ family protein [Plastoroseomonas hellenica]